MNKSIEQNAKVKFGLKSFITVVAILLVVLIAVGVLTFVIPAGRYVIYTTDTDKAALPFFQYTDDESLNKQIVINSYRQLTDEEIPPVCLCFAGLPLPLKLCSSAAAVPI